LYYQDSNSLNLLRMAMANHTAFKYDWNLQGNAAHLLLLVCFCMLFCISTATAQTSAGERIVYSYFLDDPLRTINISWFSDHSRDDSFQYRRINANRWVAFPDVETTAIPGSDTPLYRAKLRNLRPGEIYEFRIGNDGQSMHFRTLPRQIDEPLSFVTGGDLFHSAELMIPTTRQAARKNPYFAVIGGDWAYADADPLKVDRWFNLLRAWQEEMETADGFIVPFVPAIGNHEVQGGYGNNPEKAPLYFTIFDKPGKRAYFALDAGDYLTLFLLDTNHTNSVDGPQKTWLENTLAQRRNVTHLFPAYHVPAWPSFRALNNHHSTMVREHFVPLFERYGVELAFENHDHTFKRTKKIRNGRVHEDGIVYIGDGSWGVRTRSADDKDQRWWLEKVSDDHHFWNITLFPESRIAEAYNEQGVLLDSFEQGTPYPISQPFNLDREIPQSLYLAQNYPNPFNPTTLISFNVPDNPDNKTVRLELFNVSGQRVSTLVDTPLPAGTHSVLLDSRIRNLASGQYIYRLRFGNQTITKQMQLVK